MKKLFLIGLLISELLFGQPLKELSSEINRSLPLRIDSITVLKTTSASNNILTFYYNVDLEIDVLKESENWMIKNITSSVCSTPETLRLLREKIILKFTYYDKNNKYVFSITPICNTI